MTALIDAPAAPPRSHAWLAGKALTRREIEVLDKVSLGRTNNQAARELHLSVHSVKTHMVRIFSKLEVADRAEAVAQGFRSGGLKPRPLREGAVPPPLDPLSARLLREVAGGRSNQQIALAVGVGAEAAKAHLKVLFRFLGVVSRAEAVRIAVEAGYLDLAPAGSGGVS